MSNSALLKATLQWYLDHGVDEILADAPIDRTRVKSVQEMLAEKEPAVAVKQPAQAPVTAVKNQQQGGAQNNQAPQTPMMGAAQAITQAVELAGAAQDLGALQKAITEFEGLSIKKTATQIVFSDGTADAPIMVIGDVPGAQDDREGKPFMGQEGALFDKILASIGLERGADEANKAAYLTNLLNWRPPGNRTPSQSEIDISLPFLKRHIALQKPKALLIFGGAAGAALLDENLSISKLRGRWHIYKCPENGDIPMRVTYHPTYLMKTPAQKRSVWHDMLAFDEKREELGLK